ncbi:hypothetical protein HPB47_021412 [Ixodes persulcatus]|uniref:Uncharacterized protein n=1 Tax=Ixodes persulcatus TaxID=34615 RepID=A0AC60QG41_IXOPE|nr:hypothetical protein HPB47_021412 [Ixodes persulcatus]
MWDARRGLIKRWRRQKLNRKLQLRIAKLTAEAAEYAEELTRSNWGQTCNMMQGTLSTAKTWSLLKHLLDPMKSKAASNIPRGRSYTSTTEPTPNYSRNSSVHIYRERTPQRSKLSTQAPTTPSLTER